MERNEIWVENLKKSWSRNHFATQKFEYNEKRNKKESTLEGVEEEALVKWI